MMNRILFERVQHCLGPPLTLGARGKLPQLPPPVGGTVQQYANLEVELDSLIAHVSLEHVTEFVSLATRITR